MHSWAKSDMYESMTSYSGHGCTWSRTTYFLEADREHNVSDHGRGKGSGTMYFLEVERERDGVRTLLGQIRLEVELMLWLRSKTLVQVEV